MPTASSFSGRVLITGGAGFIGSHLLERLKAQGRDLTIVDDLSTGRRDNIAAHLDDHCRFIHARLGAALQNEPQLLEGVTDIYHLAAAVGVRLVVHDPATMIRNNVQETADLLQAAARTGARVLIASSSEVYGRNPWMPLAEDHELHYGPTTSPRWSYGMSKALDEHLALAWGRSHNLPVVIVRLFNTIGPRQVGQYGMVVPRFIQAALHQQPLEIHGDGRQTRSFCHVRDVVRAMTDLLGDPRHHGRVFNVGSDDEISIEQLADRILTLTHSSSRKVFVPYTQAYDRNFDDPQRRVPDVARLRQAIGFAPQYTLDQTLAELIDLARRDLK